MGMKSARFIKDELVNFSTSDVYEMWKDMGLVIQDKFGGWDLTELGKSVGGRMSKHPRFPTPTFDSEKIIDMMIEFANKKNK